MPDGSRSNTAQCDRSSPDAHAATEELYRRYAERLWRLAERQIGPRLARRIGPDDIVQSVFRTFFRRAEQGQFTIDQSESLWNLLVTIAINKIRRQAEFHAAARRAVGREVRGQEQLFALVAKEPSHEEAVALLDELELLMDGLRNPEPEIIRLTLEGHSTDEIARHIGCSRWTVRRVLNRFGRRLEGRLREGRET